MLILGLASTETVDSSAPDLAEATVKKVNALQRFWNNINWDAIVATLIEKSLSILFLIFLFFIIQRIGKYLIDRTYANYSKKQHFSESRLKTLHTLIINAFQYTLFFFFIYSLLTIVGVPVGSLLAGAGIAGVAIGLGAQGFMNDLITGFFIILEQQMDVGDYIRLLALNIEGTVTSVGLRTTQIKAVDGTVHFIPNRNITTISNLSRANMQVLIDVRINPEEGYEKICEVITEVNETLKEKYIESIQTGPDIFGMVDLGNGNFAVRTTMYVLNGKQFAVKEEFLAQYIKALTEAGFTIPNTPIIAK
ncbi:mechanosensitive ion channel family protein [Enterococcus faecalis]|uniref:mechanosensitive ion channel family protein n=1 Tax=Enterococcus faecalis TaxID=1351 RepID=UPI0019F0C198|nr:mechanosensitive ion channel family protein [Enterococcus faecalis]EGO2832639.1 mechanosensitive ion channel family protein [Enterococcus faecalis]EHS2034059.1 mechanosensitive ion channel family protein [Enterococcus faecalis]EIA1377119.1 mechanosensitive ion channel family protein [Enterococcus faecalis]MCO5395837.1 mechanosensitive ion channel family protein [Enterococcus faecalis]HDT8171237.1 mechanosensitive ion channel family protein [Enterococcus faecalis]